jgi:glycosyltransferase involved in cell wall biosynthesis
LQQPLVSVVLPTHNRRDWLAGALASVLDGQFRDFEVVVSNNGNPEDTRWLRCIITDTRVQWAEQDPTLGPLENFLAGLRLARGKYVAPLHDDDKWSPSFLAELVPPLESNPEAVLAFADHYIIDEQGSIDEAATAINTKRWGRADLREGLHQPFFRIVAYQSVPMTGCVFRRDALPVEEISSEIGSFYDIWTSYLLARGGGAAYFTPRRLMYYRTHAASQSSAEHLAAHVASIRCRRLLLEDPQLDAYRGVITSQLASDHILVGAEFLRRGRRRDARFHLKAGLRLRPTFKALVGLAASWTAPSALLTRA